MIRSARFKVPGGKMIEAELTLKGDTIETIKLTGDFYFHPEEELEELERRLEGALIFMVRDIIEQFLKERKIVLVGVDTEAIVKVILDAAGNPS